MGKSMETLLDSTNLLLRRFFMKSLKGTQTRENLMRAFAGESQAYTRYTYYADVARKEGYMQIEAVFLETAKNELEHGKRFYNFLLDGLKDELPATVEIHASYPVAQGTTLENLKAAADGEHEEWAELYSSFGEIAARERFPEVAAVFKFVSSVEKRHEERYLQLAENIEKDRVFKKDEKTYWKCRNCGYIHEGNNAPEICPSCGYPKGYFEVFAEKY